jgi:quercetin dioxygenase-like cupin family protein
METVSTAERETIEAVEGVSVTVLASGDAMNVQAFTIDSGASVPAHSHHHEQAGYLFAGHATFVLDDATHEVGPEGSYAIPAEETHAVENRGKEEVWGVECFSPPRPRPNWME